MQFKSATDVLRSLTESQPLTAVIIVIGLLLVTVIHLYYRSKTVLLIFDHLHILLKAVFVVIYLIGLLLITFILASEGTFLKFFGSAILAMVGMWFGVVKFTEQRESAAPAQ